MPVLRTLLRVVASAVALVAVVVVVLFVHGWQLAHRRDHRPLPVLLVQPDSTLVARGRHLSDISCAVCHAASGERVLAGGPRNFAALPAGPVLGRIYAPNLTPGGRLKTTSDPEILRAIRNGLARDHRPLIGMPSYLLLQLSEGDAAALLAYLRSQPEVTADVTPRRLNALGYLALGLHVIATSAVSPPNVIMPEIPAARSREFGEYMIALATCRSCHGPRLRGGPRGQMYPVGGDLLGFVRAQPLEVFARALREGRGADGRQLDPARMPWKAYARLTDAEVAATYEYLRAPIQRR